MRWVVVWRLIEQVGIRFRTVGVRRVRSVCGLDPLRSGGLTVDWSPTDFGTARMAALGFLLAQAERENTTDALLLRSRQARDRRRHDPRPFWDEFYLALLLDDGKKTYDTARDLTRAAPNDPSAGYTFLYAVALGGNPPSGLARAVRNEEAEAGPALAPDDAALVRDAFISVVRSNPAWAYSFLVNAVLSELKRAGRGGELDALYGELLATAHDLHTISIASDMAADRGDFDGLWKLFASFYRLPSATRSTVFQTQGYLILTATGTSYVPAYHMARGLRHKADARSHAEILRLLDDYMTALRSPATGRRSNPDGEEILGTPI